MGFVAVISLVVGAASTIAQVAASRKAARAQREANAISGASQEIQDRVARRRAAREARIRRAMVAQGAVNSGVSGSSGELGALSALQSNYGASVANQTSQRLGSEGVTRTNQQAADAQGQFERAGAYGALFQQGLDLYSTWKDGQL